MKRYFLVLAVLLMMPLLVVSCGYLTAKKDELQKNSNGGTTIKQQETVKNSLGKEFVKIPAGSFTMGSPESEPGPVRR